MPANPLTLTHVVTYFQCHGHLPIPAPQTISIANSAGAVNYNVVVTYSGGSQGLA